MELIAWKTWKDFLAIETNGNFVIEEPFPNAWRTSLTWMRKITVTNHADYLPVFQSMSTNSLFDIVFVDTDEVIINADIEVNAPPLSVLMDTVAVPECGSPYTPNDPEVFTIEDHFKNLQMECAWSITRGNPNITVGIVDIYFDTNNTDLAGKFLNNPGCQALDQDGNNEYGPAGTDSIARGIQARFRHGTAMAGGVAAIMDNNKCLAGTGGNTTIKGYCSAGVLDRIEAAIDDGNPIVSISVQNSLFTSPGQEATIRNLFEDGVDRGVTFTFAINGLNGRHLENIPGLLNVGFGWRTGAYRPYERDGFDDENIEFIVPASAAFTLHGRDSCRSNFGGSSLGAAYLAGIVALMLDVNPCLTPADVEQILYESSENINNSHSFPTYFEPGKGKVNAYQAVLGAQNFAGQSRLTVASGVTETIQAESRRYNDIKVETGGVLEINDSRVSIEGNQTGPYQNGRIVVERGAKLIIRNSTITGSGTSGLCSDNFWSGIRVHGNIDQAQPNLYDASGDLQVNTPLSANEAGVVILLQGTILENATNAVATSAPGYPYQEQVDRWGGLIIADNVTFLNNFRAAEFLQYPRRDAGNTFKNKSIFNNCDFITEDPNDDRSLGITLWDTDDVKVTRSTFVNIGRESILTIDGSYVVEDGNKFSNDIERPNHRHIATMTTHPYGPATRIGSDDTTHLSNTFLSKDANDVFIYSDDVDPRDRLIITGNTFSYNGMLTSGTDAPAGIEIVGPQRYTIYENTFNSCRRPIVLDNTGSENFAGGNSISCNFFSEINGSLRFENSNVGTQIIQNTFNGSSTFSQISANLSWNGLSDFQQGSSDDPANNIFDNLGPQRDISASLNGNVFLYWYTDNGSGGSNSFEPLGSSAGYENSPTVQPESNLCGQSIPPGFQGPNNPVEIETVRTELAQLDQYLVTNPTDTAKLIERQETALELDQRVNQYIYLTVEKGEIDSAINVLNTLNTAGAEIRSFGIYVGDGRYVDAAQKLPLINSYGTEYEEFVYVQNVNLDRLTATTEYTLSTQIKNKLAKYAGGNSRFRGYSRALLLLLEDERYYDTWEYTPPVTKSDEDNSILATLTPTVKPGKVEVYPNPSDGIIRIRGAQLTEVTSIDLLDHTGRLLLTIQVQEREQLDINLNQTAGIYFLAFRGKQQTFSRKIIIK